jgi:hypothetical protein
MAMHCKICMQQFFIFATFLTPRSSKYTTTHSWGFVLWAEPQIPTQLPVLCLKLNSHFKHTFCPWAIEQNSNLHVHESEPFWLLNIFWLKHLWTQSIAIGASDRFSPLILSHLSSGGGSRGPRKPPIEVGNQNVWIFGQNPKMVRTKTVWMTIFAL